MLDHDNGLEGTLCFSSEYSHRFSGMRSRSTAHSWNTVFWSPTLASHPSRSLKEGPTNTSKINRCVLFNQGVTKMLDLGLSSHVEAIQSDNINAENATVNLAASNSNSCIRLFAQPVSFPDQHTPFSFYVIPLHDVPQACCLWQTILKTFQLTASDTRFLRSKPLICGQAWDSST